MKYIVPILAFLVFFSFSTSTIDSQVLDSDYVRQSEIEGDVLGVLGEDVSDVEEDEVDDEFLKNRIIEIMAMIGGLILVALFAYIVYEKKDR
jgi:hypothetical protein